MRVLKSNLILLMMNNGGRKMINSSYDCILERLSMYGIGGGSEYLEDSYTLTESQLGAFYYNAIVSELREDDPILQRHSVYIPREINSNFFWLNLNRNI